MKMKKGDNVVIISGKDKGKSGKVLRVLPKEARIVVEGVNVRKRHRKPRRTGERGEIFQLPSPVSVSNAKLVCGKCKKATRIKLQVSGERKVRMCKKCGAEF